MHRLTLLAAACALAAAPAITIHAQQDRAQQQQGQGLQQGQQGQDRQQSIQGEQPMDDRIFAMAAAASGMAEIGISRLALQKTEDEQVRAFAEQMIEDHTQANQQLMQIAEAKGVQLPQGPELKDTASALALAGCSPESFPQEYFKQQEGAHILAVGLFKAQAERGQDEDLREFARNLLPKLEEHLQMARQHSGSGSTQQQQQPQGLQEGLQQQDDQPESRNDDDAPSLDDPDR